MVLVDGFSIKFHFLTVEPTCLGNLLCQWENIIGTKAYGRLLVFLGVKFDVETLGLTFPFPRPALCRGAGNVNNKGEG